MNMFEIAALVGAGFVAGRISHSIVKNQRLKAYQNELVSLALRVEAARAMLKSETEDLRENYKNLVNDAAEIVAEINPEESGKWSDSDDILLQSWGNADGKYND